MSTARSGSMSSSTDSKKSHEELASNYALQVALQTMKERCQQLQARLSVVEEENLQLKIEKQRYIRQENKINTNLCDIDRLQEQIAQLSRQKSQLTHHIYMVATENKHLWTRLSLLTEANESLGTRLSKISVALNNHTSKSERLLQEVNQDTGNPSLEEISLKLINNFQLEKNELEQQYAEMVELHSFKDCDFTLASGDDCDNKLINETDTEIEDSEEEVSNEMLSNDLKQCQQQLFRFLNAMKNQKENLQNTLNLLKKFSNGDDNCLVCKKFQENSKKAYRDVEVMALPSEIIEKDSIDEEVRNITESSKMQTCYCKMKSEQRICPMCGCTYYNTDNVEFMDEFIEHVRSHFPQIEIKADEFDEFYHEQPPSVL